MLRQQRDNRRKVFLFALTQAVPPFLEFVSVFDIPTQYLKYSIDGIMAKNIPFMEYLLSACNHERIKQIKPI
jgi:hypothetical protein